MQSHSQALSLKIDPLLQSLTPFVSFSTVETTVFISALSYFVTHSMLSYFVVCFSRFRFFKNLKNLKSPKVRFLGFYFLVILYTDHI